MQADRTSPAQSPELQAQLQRERRAIERAQASGELRAQDDRFTTPAAQQRERDILALESAARGTRAPVMTRQALASLGSRCR